MANELLEKIDQTKILDDVLDDKVETNLSPEHKIDKPVETLNESVKLPTAAVKKNNADVTPAVLSLEEKRSQEIDKILSEGLNDAFLAMPPAKQQEFKREGEETVKKINVLLSHAHTSLSKIISLIKNWLSFIPGVNRFFLSQEAKIKSDQIMKLKDKL
jgi:hypothetical protein